MYLGWYDPDNKTPVWLKVLDAVNRYVEKFGHHPDTCLTSTTDAEELLADANTPPLTIRSVNCVPRFTYYVGSPDPEEEAP